MLDAAYAAGLGTSTRPVLTAARNSWPWLAGRGHADVIVGSKWGNRYTGGWRLDASQQEVKEHSLVMSDPSGPEPGPAR